MKCLFQNCPPAAVSVPPVKNLHLKDPNKLSGRNNSLLYLQFILLPPTLQQRRVAEDKMSFFPFSAPPCSVAEHGSPATALIHHSRHIFSTVIILDAYSNQPFQTDFISVLGFTSPTFYIYGTCGCRRMCLKASWPLAALLVFVAGDAVWLLWFISRHLSVCLFLFDWSAVIVQQVHTDTTCPVKMKIWIFKVGTISLP